MRLILLPVMSSIALAVLATACTATWESDPATPRTDEEQAVEQAIDRMWREHIAAARRKDAGAVMDIYAPGASYIVPGSADHRGRPAIEAMERATLRSTEVGDARHTTRALNVVGDVAYELGSVVGPVGPPGEEPTVLTFHFIAQWKRQNDGAWRIEHFFGEAE